MFYVLIVDYSKEIESQLFQCSLSNFGCLFARCLKPTSENAKKAIPGKKGRGDKVECISQLERPGYGSGRNKPYRYSKPSNLKQLRGLTKDPTFLLATFSLTMDSVSVVSQPKMIVSQQTMQFYYVV